MNYLYSFKLGIFESIGQFSSNLDDHNICLKKDIVKPKCVHEKIWMSIFMAKKNRKCLKFEKMQICKKIIFGKTKRGTILVLIHLLINQRTLYTITDVFFHCVKWGDAHVNSFCLILKRKGKKIRKLQSKTKFEKS